MCVGCIYYIVAVLGMNLRKVTSLGSNLASVTDFKRIETPHSLCCDFGGYKIFTPIILGFGADKYLGLPGQVGRASTKQGVSESAAVAAGSNRLA